MFPEWARAESAPYIVLLEIEGMHISLDVALASR